MDHENAKIITITNIVTATHNRNKSDWKIVAQLKIYIAKKIWLKYHVINQTGKPVFYCENKKKLYMKGSNHIH